MTSPSTSRVHTHAPERTTLDACVACGDPSVEIGPNGKLLCGDCADEQYGTYGRSRGDRFFGLLRRLFRITY